MHLDVELTLGRNLVEATATGITLHIDDTQTVTGILTDTLERGEQTGLDLRLQILHLFLQLIFLSTGLSHDLLEFRLLHIQVTLTLSNHLLISLQLVLLLLNTSVGLTDLLVAEFNLQCLELDFLAQCVILTVVLHLIELTLITSHAGLSLNDLTFLLGDGALELSNLVLDLLNTGGQTFDLIFQVLNLKRQLTSQCTLLVDSRECSLKLIKGLQLLFHSQICRIFLCHNSLRL